MIEIQFNGEPVAIHQETTITQLLERRELDSKFCAVELNEEIVAKQEFDRHLLTDGDRLEIVTLVGGG